MSEQDDCWLKPERSVLGQRGTGQGLLSWGKGTEGFPGPVRCKWRDTDTQQLAGDGGRRWGREGKARAACARKGQWHKVKVQGPERAANTHEPHVLRTVGDEVSKPSRIRGHD